MCVIIERPGMLTTIQDTGRRGHQAIGVPVAGPMDPWSARLANRLAGNPDGAALLEVTLIGPRFRLERDACVGVAGAAFDVDVGARTERSPCRLSVRAGEVVAFRTRHAGARAYVAFGGGVQVPLVLGSAATDIRGRLGGLAGRALRAGDRVPIGPPRGALPHRAPAGEVAVALPEGPCAVLPGPMADAWSAGAFEVLCATPFDVTTSSDRMGYRLHGRAGWPEVPATLISFPTTRGAVQLPPSGEPILLMADRQTTGGYPVIAVAARAGWPLLGQLAPGDELRFARVSLHAAREAWLRLEAALDAMAPRVSA